jgi:hypothetical protein
MSTVPPITDSDVAALVAAAQADTDAENAVVVLLGSVFTKLQAAIAGAQSLSATDRAALNAVTAQLNTNKAALAAAVVLDTPSA